MTPRPTPEIAYRLKQWSTSDPELDALLREAADRLEQQHAALKAIAEGRTTRAVEDVARAALGGDGQ